MSVSEICQDWLWIRRIFVIFCSELFHIFYQIFFKFSTQKISESEKLKTQQICMKRKTFEMQIENRKSPEAFSSSFDDDSVCWLGSFYRFHSSD